MPFSYAITTASRRPWRVITQGAARGQRHPHGRERSLGILTTEFLSIVPACTPLFQCENGKGGLASAPIALLPAVPTEATTATTTILHSATSTAKLSGLGLV